MSSEEIGKKLRKKYGENAFKSILDDDPLEVIPSGILSVDYCSGVGGLARGMHHVFEGVPSAGKTEIMLDCMDHYLSLNPYHKVAIVDVENRLKKDRLKLRNMDLTRIGISRCAIAEKVFDIMCDLIQDGSYGMIGVDSIAMLTPISDFEKEIEDQTKPGTHGNALSKGFRKLGALMMELNSKTINIFINQCMANIGGKQWEPKTIAKSGFAPKYLSSFTIEVERLLGKERITTDSSGTTVGNDIKLTCRKNSLSQFQHRKAIFHLNYTKGPVLSSELLNLGMGYGLISKAGRGQFSINIPEQDPYPVKGYDNLVTLLDTHDTFPVLLKKLIQDKIKNGELTSDPDEDLIDGDD